LVGEQTAQAYDIGCFVNHQSISLFRTVLLGPDNVHQAGFISPLAFDFVPHLFGHRPKELLKHYVSVGAP
jgi:hypothetical protein